MAPTPLSRLRERDGVRGAFKIINIVALLLVPLL
jgi:hypothetical protein